MELGSTEHKQLLLKSILKVALKTALFGLIIGVFFIIPSWVRENTFSMGVAYAGNLIILGSIIYAILIAFKKYRKIIIPFDETFNK